ncbi:serine hydrolase domain-containing protein [Halovulum sp. GXIMD14794]
MKSLSRRRFLAGATALAASPATAAIDPVLESVAGTRQLRAVLVAHRGRIVADRGFNGFNSGSRTNIKSASKSVIATLAGIAIDRGVLSGPDHPIAPFLEDRFPENPDPRLWRITVGDLLSMRAGLEPMSGQNYGRWVSSRNWVETALAAPFVSEPGEEMLYSSASTHLVSAILTRASGRSMLDLALDWLGPVEGFEILGWDRDPQGIYFGGNQMSMTTRSLLAFGELYRRGGRALDGSCVVSDNWINAAWTPRTKSPMSGAYYGYCWFLRPLAGVPTHFGWGYGGQMIYVLPSKDLTIAITSNPLLPSQVTGYREQLDALAANIVRET